MYLKNSLSLYVIVTLLFCFNLTSTEAQTKMDSLGNYFYDMGLSSLWGYSDSEGREYALVGVINGLSIVDITEPTNPEELFFIPQPSGFWREIKNWQNYAYVANETDEGILIVDLGHLPDTVFYTNYTADSLIKTSHALWIDEFGYAYIAGYNNFTGSVPVNNRGVAILDLNSDPMNPVLVNQYTDQYVHDMYVRDNIMYACEIYAGQFTVIDVSDKTNLEVIAHQNTPSLFTHNAWLSDNGQYLFTTDEKNNAYVTAYDVSDWSDIKEVARYQSNPGSLSMPHNVHVLNDFLVISYYRDGVKIVDAHEPDILVETEYFDTSPQSGPGSQGCWGVYQLFPSGNVIASDRQLGLFIMKPDYRRAAYLRGTVINSQTGLPISGATLQISSTNVSATSDLTGQFKAGVALGGNYNIQFSRYGYETLLLSDVTLTEAETLYLTVELVPLDPFVVQINVKDQLSGNNLSNAYVEISHSQGNYSATTNSSGIAEFEGLYDDNFYIYAANWGNLPKYQQGFTFSNSDNEATVLLEKGVYDDFYTDLGWSVNNVGANPEGNWIKQTPIASYYGDTVSNPDTDVPGDTGSECFMTGNGFGANTQDHALITGNTTLYSPPFDLSGYSNPYLSFYRWFVAYNSVNNADSLNFYLSNGFETVLLHTVNANDFYLRQWVLESFRISDYIEPTAGMQLIITASAASTDVIMECGFDLFQITDDYAPQVGINMFHTSKSEIKLIPNPVENIAYLYSDAGIHEVSVFDIQGQLIKTYKTSDYNTTNQVTIETNGFNSGLYIVQVKTISKITVLKMEVVR